jgi:hypothetical protein
MNKDNEFAIVNPGTLILFVGLPGSGKSSYIQELGERNPSFSIYDDFQGQAYNHDPDPRLSKHFGPLVSDLKSGKTAVVSDIRYCAPKELNIFLSAVLSAVPNVLLQFKYFENQPEQCKENVRTRNREGRLEQELELIDNLSESYYIPPIENIPVYNRS